ncbi:MAG TPA: outer membrane beta-barrel protein [Chitinophagaceae bacterium]|nr:outer membrane beta-barrel protein [Chitinophagaceae bacterium]
MQEKKFEEEVRRKMTELSFTPSDPVWARVEKEIRNKRKGRRVFLWLFPLLFVTGLTYYIINNGQEPATVKNAPSTSTSIKSSHHPKSSNETKDNLNPSKETSHSLQEPSVAVPLNQPTGEVRGGGVSEPVTSSVSKTISKNYNNGTYRISNYTTSNRSVSETGPGEKREEVVGSIYNTPANSDKEQPGEHSKEGTDDAGKVLSHAAETGTQDVDSTRKITSASDSIMKPAADTIAAINNEVANPRKNAKKRWIVSINTSIGITGVSTKTLPFVSGNKSNVYQYTARDNMFVSSTAAPGAAMANLRSVVVPDAPSKVRRNLGFSASIGLNKKINSRIGFSSGLQYARFSTLTSIGRKVQGASASANDFYLNTSLVAKDYETHYDVLEVPLSLDWQVLRTKPLRLHAGIGFGYLITTNALQYDPAMNIYFVDKSLYRTTQFSARTGFDYTIMKKGNHSLSIGPKVGFGLSNLLKRKTYGQQHLYFAGIGSSFSF